MKRSIAGLIAGLILGTAGIAGASPSAQSDMHANGIWCKPGGGGVACIAMDGSRYGVGITDQFVMVMDTKSGKNVFVRRH